ncbi:MAG: FlgD immunoglobulin-like domain containing protein [Armatimonadota bacterium]|nr:FlgD immunoglobulin-like domain containing protein [Armatimonadota bacterium]
MTLILCAPCHAEVTITRVSVASDGTQSNGTSAYSHLSDDGRYVAFHSAAGNLVTGDADVDDDCFVHDRDTGQTVRVSVSSSGQESHKRSIYPKLSGNGRYVTFESDSPVHDPPDENNAWDVFLHDLTTHETTLVSRNSAGVQGNSDSTRGTLSYDGRYLAFQSGASNLVADDTNSRYDCFVRDLTTGQTTRVSVSSSGAQANGGSVRPSISSDGRYVLFCSYASNLVPGDTNGGADIFLHDRQTGTTTRVSVSTAGAQANGASSEPWLSSNGQCAVFCSEASNLVSGDTNGDMDVFARDLTTGTTTRVSVSTGGGQVSGDSLHPCVSGNGRFVGFQSGSPQLDPPDNNGEHDVFVHDRDTGETWRISKPVSTTSSSVKAREYHEDPSMNYEGSVVGFTSVAPNLVPDDTNGIRDIFVYEWPADIHEIIFAEGPSGDPNPVASGGQVQCSVTARCNRGHNLTYQWTAEDAEGDPVGEFDNASAESPTWTVPENTTDEVADYTLSVTVTCAQDSSVSDTASYTQQVNPIEHTVTITEGPSGDPNPVASGGDVQCSVTAEDSRDGHTLTYEWTARDGDGNPAGQFDDPSAASPTWTAPDNRSDALAEYTISVTASCTGDSSVKDTGSYVHQVKPVAHTITITEGPSGDPNPVESGGRVGFILTAEDSRKGHWRTYEWSAVDADGDPAGSFDDPTLHYPIWTAPENTSTTVEEYTISVTVTCVEDPDVSATGSHVQKVNPVPHEVLITEGPSGDPNPVASEGQVQCSVSAECRRGHDVTYQWAARDGNGDPAGSFDDATAQNPTWTAPANNSDQLAEYTISVTVGCAEDPSISTTASYSQFINTAAHAVGIIDGPWGDANPAASGADVQCSVTAVDTWGHTLLYQWTAVDGEGNPAGGFDDATAENPTWTAPANATDNVMEYTIAVTVTCSQDDALSDSASYVQQVAPVAHEVTITRGPSATPGLAASQGPVHCSVTAEDSREGHTLSYEWTAEDAEGNPAGSFDDAAARHPTWTAPENATYSPMAYTMAVTVTCDKGEGASDSCTVQVMPTVIVDLAPGWNQPSCGQPAYGLAPFAELLGPDARSAHLWNAEQFAYAQVDLAGTAASEHAGVGMWVLSTSEATRRIAVQEPSPLQVSVSAGWNLLANPFPGSLELSTGLIPDGDGQIITPVHHWNAPQFSYEQMTVVPAGCSFWALATYSGTATFDPAGLAPASAAAGAVSLAEAPEVPDGSTCIQLAARAGDTRDMGTWIGTTADDQALKTPKPPMMPGAVGAYLDVEDGIGYARSLAPQGVGHTWTLTVNSPEEQEVSLRIVDTSQLPGHMAVWLRDLATGQRIDLRHAPSYSYTARQGQRQFEIEVGERDDLLQVMGVSAQAAGDGAQISFTLSAAGTVTVDVLNIAGRTVRRIVAGRECDAGVQTVAWDGRSHSGTQVPSGIYLIRVTASAPTGEQTQGLCSARIR